MRYFLYVCLLFLPIITSSQHILPEKERATVVDEILSERFDTLLPQLMDDVGIDMWIVISENTMKIPYLGPCYRLPGLMRAGGPSLYSIEIKLKTSLKSWLWPVIMWEKI